MDFRSESYVRLYTRDSPTWIHMPWQGRVTWPLLMRKLEKDGRYHLGPWGIQGLADDLRVPLEVVEAGVTALVTSGILVKGDGILFAPRFYEAQNAQRAKTPAERQAELRQRRKDAELSIAQPPLPHVETTPNVTAVTGPRDMSRLVPSAVLPSALNISTDGATQTTPPEGAEPPPGPPHTRRGAKKKSKRPSRSSIAEPFTPHDEDLARLRAELHVDPLEGVVPFVEHCRKRGVRSHDWRAEFRDFVRKRVAMGLLKPKTNGVHHTMSPARSHKNDPPALSPEDQAPLARGALDALDKIGGTT